MKENKFVSFLKWFFHSYIWIGVLVLAIDIISKNIICNLMEEGDSIVLIPNFLSITYTINRKAAFGIGSDNLVLNKVLYVSIALIISAGICVYFAFKNKKLPGYVKAALMMVVAGAIGNVIDRLFYSPEYLHAYAGEAGGVVDFIDFFKGSALHDLWHYIFNIADSGVVVGVFMLLVWVIIDEVKEYKAKKVEKDDAKVLSKSEKEKQENIEKNKVE